MALFGAYLGMSFFPFPVPDFVKGVMLFAVSQAVHESWKEWKESVTKGENHV